MACAAQKGPPRPGRDEAGGRDDPLDAAQERRVRAVLALGGVPQADLPDGVQQVRLRLLERAANGARGAAGRVRVGGGRRLQPRHGLAPGQAPPGAARGAAGLPAPARAALRRGHAACSPLAVAQGLDELPDAQRQVLVLRFYADLPVRAIAEELGIPEGTVKSRLHTAVRALRARLHEDEVV